MADREIKYLLDLDGVKTLYDEIMKDVNGRTINVGTYNELSSLTDDDLLNVDTVILVYE